MIQSRRGRVQDISAQPTTNAGLWLDKYIDGQLLKGEKVAVGKTTPQAKLVSTVSDIMPPDVYANFFQRWEKSLHSLGIVTKRASVQGRLSIGLGDESVLETAITLHRTYGVPYIPGSALKGLAANYALNRLDEATWGLKSDAYQIMFGDTSSAGYLTFFDTLYVPDTGHDKKSLWPDVITVHHPDYYQQGNVAPADWDSPTPIPFITATGDYLIAISGNPAWVQAAFKILALALKEEGVGAKTSSGYGRMQLEIDAPVAPVSSQEAATPNDPEDPAAASLLRRVRALPASQVASQIPQLAEKWRSLATSAEAKRQIAAEMVLKIQQAKRDKAWANQPWYQELLSFTTQE